MIQPRCGHGHVNDHRHHIPMIDQLLRLDSYQAYALPLVGALALYVACQAAIDYRNRRVRNAAIDAGMTEPPSLHPVIDPAKCIGCGACTHACPEGKIIGLINGKAELIDPTSCIGHGACKTACPSGAIKLVFGTATRGVDIPQVSSTFESNVPGVFIAGELGGMGLIANAIEQGRQAVDAIAKLDGLRRREQYDVLIVGAGPAGIAASLSAKQQKLRAIAIEQGSFGGTVAHYPRAKIIMTRTATLPGYGRVRFRKVRKERLLELWTKVVHKSRIPIRYGECVEQVIPRANGFDVITSQGRYATRSVLLATGRRGSPNKLGILGEELSKVVYSLVDPRQYRGQRVIVVGGGDSALETAAALAREDGIDVTLCYRGQAFSRAKPRNRAIIETAVQARRLRVLFDAELLAVRPDWVDLMVGGRRHAAPNDAVIVCAGGVVPGDFLRQIGIAVETRYGT
jgi:thioredoxin reductase (NADPH)